LKGRGASIVGRKKEELLERPEEKEGRRKGEGHNQS